MSKKNNKKSNNEDFTKSILHKIQDEHIQMTPKWCFMVREYLFWLIVTLSIFVGAVSVSVIILHTLHLDLAIAVRASGGIIQHIASFAPYLWLVLLSLFTILTWYNFKYTKIGYRYSYVLVIFGSIIASTLLGIALYFSGAAQHAEEYAIKISKGYYSGSSMNRQQMWIQPDKGLLAGILAETLIDTSKVFVLVDFYGKTWNIDMEQLSQEEKIMIASVPKIAVIGRRDGENIFTACRIIPWTQMGQRGEMRKRVQAVLPNGVTINKRSMFELGNNVCSDKE